MQVANPNNVKIYNLTSGKSLPDFISDRKKRQVLKNDEGLRRRIELIQDFGMPTVSTKVKMSPDGEFIFAAGTYKPRLKCFDVSQLSLKFERCLDAEVVTFDVLSDDYSKLVMLLNDRSIELHTQQGRHYSVRMPKFGRDMAYHNANCDLMLVGAGPEIYRLNLDQGRFLKSYETQSPELHSCALNPLHNLLMVGGSDGHIECWDPRSRCRAGILDCSARVQEYIDDNSTPKVSSLKFNGALTLAVGMSSGQVLLYDIRKNMPSVIKDHRYDLPIHSIAFNAENNLVISSDSKCVKLWDDQTAEAITAVELESDINDMCLVEDSGLFFLANESPKISTYFIPTLGPAPKWCSFLDNLTEEMEESSAQEVYDDYKFLTRKEIDSLGLSNLIGTSLLRAYMHGYFVDMRLYHKAVAVANPFAFKEYREKKIAEKIEEGRQKRVNIKKLPKVNKALAERLMTRATDHELTSGKKKKMKREAANLLDDPRFKAMFEDTSFQVDEESEEFRLLNPVVSKQFEKLHTAAQDVDDEFSDGNDVDGGSSSEEDRRKWIKESKKVVHNKTSTARERHRAEESATDLAPRMFEMKDDHAVGGERLVSIDDLDKFGDDALRRERKRKVRSTLGDRIAEQEEKVPTANAKKVGGFATGAKEVSFRIKKNKNNNDKTKTRVSDEKQHRDERRELRRPANKLRRSKPPAADRFFKR